LNGKGFDAACAGEAADENIVATFACGITLKVRRLQGNQDYRWFPIREHPGVIGRRRKTRMKWVRKRAT
jgi:hypothetical protein